MKKKYKDFYENLFISKIADTPKWSVSDSKKRPINLKKLKEEQQIQGANFHDMDQLTTLEGSIAIFHDLNDYPPNHAFYLEALKDDYIVLDIEPNCPNNLKDQFLSMPYVYGEYSMSGKGYHLVFKTPDYIKNHKTIKYKTKIQHRKKYYEILINHWVTFTRKQLPEKQNNKLRILFNDLMNQPQNNTNITMVSNFKCNTKNKAHIEKEDIIQHELQKRMQYYKKDIHDFNLDKSRYEYSIIGYTYQTLLKIIMNLNIVLTKEQKLWIIYETVKDFIPKRAKHNSFRHNMPWLMYLTYNIITKNEK